MAEKDKKINVKSKKNKTQSVVEPKIVSPKEEDEFKVVEQRYPAIRIAELLNISSFDFYMMKQNLGITDGSFLTMSEFQNEYNKIIKR